MEVVVVFRMISPPRHYFLDHFKSLSYNSPFSLLAQPCERKRVLPMTVEEAANKHLSTLLKRPESTQSYNFSTPSFDDGDGIRRHAFPSAYRQPQASLVRSNSASKRPR